MFTKAQVKLTDAMNRWSGAAPAACCGACKPCVTQAATSLVVVAAGASIEAAASRRQAKSEDATRRADT